MTGKRVLVHEHRPLARRDGTVKVEETDDHWVIPDCVLTTDGVMNGARKTREELARTWLMFNGIPFVHEHPGFDEFGVIIDQRRIGGWVDNVRFTDETGDVVGDVYLAKKPLPGLEVTPDMVKQNEALVADLRAGKARETSIGFWSSDEKLPAPATYDGPNKEFQGHQYDRIQRYIVPDHNAAVPMGACGTRCAVGSAQQGDAHAHAHEGNTNKDAMHMTKPNQDCTQQELLDRLTKAEKALADAQKAAPGADAGKVAVLEANLKTTTDALKVVQDQLAAAEKARLDGKRRDLAALVVPAVAGKQEAAVLDAKVQEFASWPEPALDFAIAREKSFRGKADATRIQTTQGDGQPALVVDGIAATPYGFTVVDSKAAVKAGRGAGVN